MSSQATQWRYLNDEQVEAPSGPRARAQLNEPPRRSCGQRVSSRLRDASAILRQAPGTDRCKLDRRVESAQSSQVKFRARTCPGGEFWLASELRQAGLDLAPVARPSDSGRRAGHGTLEVTGSLDAAYRALCHSRLLQRLDVQLSEFPLGAADPYEALREVDWLDTLDSRATFRIDAIALRGAAHTPRHLVLRTKDALVDAFQDAHLPRPSVAKEAPDLSFFVSLIGETLSLGVSLLRPGGAQRRSGDRQAIAPLRETLAAAMLRAADWPTAFPEDAACVDLCCGSGTLLREAVALAQGRVALVEAYGERGEPRSAWLGHDIEAFHRNYAEAAAEDAEARRRPLTQRFFGTDSAQDVLQEARRLAERAQMPLRLQRGELKDAVAPEGTGLVISNPPYGRRIGQANALVPLYSTLGDRLRRHFLGWRAAILCADTQHRQALGLKPDRRDPMRNGPIDCELVQLSIATEAPRTDQARWRNLSQEGAMLRDRLRKVERKLSRWAKREGVEAYRLYASDIPEVRAVIDRYGDRVHARVYRPRTLQGNALAQRLVDVEQAIAEGLGVPKAQQVIKAHSMAEVSERAAPLATKRTEQVIREGDFRFSVNLEDHIDTGLFLDQRAVRRGLRDAAKERAVLNLFAYTCSASVAAAMGGARSVTSVDLSRRYLAWGEANARLNPACSATQMQFKADDVMRFLQQGMRRYDLIYCAPPRASKSHRGATFVLEADLEALLDATTARLKPGGTCWLSLPGSEGLPAELAANWQERTASYLDPDLQPKRPPFRLYHFSAPR